jgi:hypothetical protein
MLLGIIGKEYIHLVTDTWGLVRPASVPRETAQQGSPWTLIWDQLPWSMQPHAHAGMQACRDRQVGPWALAAQKYAQACTCMQVA